MKRLMVISALLLSACGGGGSESNLIELDNKTDPATFKADGIYLSADALMIVDADKQVWASDFATDAVIRFDSAHPYGNKLDLKGVTLWPNNGNRYLNPNLSVTLTFDGDKAQAMTVITNQPFVHDFVRQPVSLPLADLTGTYNNETNTAVWMIDNAGNVDVNLHSDCTMSGKITANDFYYDIEAKATNCAAPEFNGEYKGLAFTATYQGKLYLASAVTDSQSKLAMWDLVPL